MKKPLEGIRVLSFAQVLAGTYTQMVLGDLGAEIIKIEKPGRGDDARAFGPHVRGESTYFTSLNRNAKSVVINLQHPRGREIVLELVKVSDVLLENFRVGVMDRLGLGYKEIKKVKPKIVYASITGFGQLDILPSPYGDRPAYDIIAQALGGIMSINGPAGGPPVKVGAGVGDIIPGLFGVVGILAALRVARETGEGQEVDISMVDGVMAVLENAVQIYTHTGVVRGPEGNKHHTVTPYDAYACKDGWVVIAAGNDKLWANLCQALGWEEWIGDSRFQTNVARQENYESLIKPRLSAWAENYTRAEIEEFLLAHGVPVAPVLTTKEIVASPHVKAREMLVEVEHPVIGKEVLVNSPIKLSKTMPGISSPAPTLGQHTKEVLKELLGYNEALLAELCAEKVIEAK